MDDGIFTARLLCPPALDNDLQLTWNDGAATLWDGDATVAVARRDHRQLTPVAPVSRDVAARAESGYGGLHAAAGTWQLPVVGGRFVVVAEERARHGRRVQTAASLYDDSGALLGTAEHQWIEIDPASFT